MNNQSSTQKRRTIYELMEHLSPQSMDTGKDHAPYDYKDDICSVIDKPVKFNQDVDTMISGLMTIDGILGLVYDICPFPDDHAITLSLSEIRNIVIRVSQLAKSEKIKL